MSEQNSYQNKEFQWFILENKVRQLIHQLMQPFQKRLNEQRATAQSMRREINDSQKSIMELSALINTGKKPEQLPVFRKIFQQMDQLQQKIKNLSQSNDLVHRKIGDKLSDIHKLQKESSSHLEAVRNENVAIRSEFSRQQAWSVEMYEKAVKEFKQMEDGLLNRIKENVLSTKRLQAYSKSLDQKNQFLMNQNRLTLESVASLKDKLTQHHGLLDSHSFKIKSLQQSSSQLAEDNQIIDKLKSKVEDYLENTYKIQDFLATLLPLHIQTQINDTIEVVARNNTRKRFQIFRKQKLQDFNELILRSSGCTKLPSKHHYESLLKEQTISSHQAINNIKIEVLKAQDIFIQKLQFQQRQFVMENCRLSIQLFQDQLSQNNFNKSTATLDDKTFQTIQQEINNAIHDSKRRIELELKDGKTFLSSFSDEIRVQNQRYEDSVDKKVNNFRTRIDQLQLKLQYQVSKQLCCQQGQRLKQLERVMEGLGQNDAFFFKKLKELLGKQGRGEEQKALLGIRQLNRLQQKNMYGLEEYLSRGRTLNVSNQEDSKDKLNRPRTVRSSLYSRNRSKRATSRGDDSTYSNVSNSFVFHMRKKI